MTPNPTDRDGLVERLLDHHAREIWDWDLLQEAAAALRESQERAERFESAYHDGTLLLESAERAVAEAQTELAALREDANSIEAWKELCFSYEDRLAKLTKSAEDLTWYMQSVEMPWLCQEEVFRRAKACRTDLRAEAAMQTPSGDGGGG